MNLIAALKENHTFSGLSVNIHRPLLLLMATMEGLSFTPVKRAESLSADKLRS
jgi:hypothetical protein